MNISDILSIFEAKKSGSQYLAKCPAHADQNPSLSIKEGSDGRVLIHCHAGCLLDAVLDAVKLTTADLFNGNGHLSPSKPQISATYDYIDESGRLLYQTVRMEPKTFRQRRPDRTGDWIWKLDDVRRVLYRLPDLLESDPNEPVYFVEGEKDADRLADLGFISTTNVCGAKSWRAEYADQLAGRDVVIFPDNDKPGRDYAENVAKDLHGKSKGVRIVYLPDLPEKGDISDWLNAGGTVEDLRRLVDAAPIWTAETAEQNADLQTTDEPVRLSKLWGEFEKEIFEEAEIIAFGLEHGEVGLLNSLPDAGKTTLSLNVSLSLCLGFPFGVITEGGKARRVLYIDGETRRARLQRDIKRMAFGFSPDAKAQLREQLSIICEGEIDEQSLSLTNERHLLMLSADAIDFKPDLIVIDTLASLCPLFNENDNAEQSRKIWRPLQKLARDTNSAVLVIHHIGKRSEDSQAPESVYRGRGASASGAFARAVWQLTPDPNIQGLVTLSCKKMKSQKPQDVRFQLDHEARWFAETAPPPPVKSSFDLVVESITGEMTTAEIVAALPDISERWVKDSIKKAVERGLVEKAKRGTYRPVGEVRAHSASPLNAQTAQSAQLPKFHNAGRAIKDIEEEGAKAPKPQRINNFEVQEDRALALRNCTTALSHDAAALGREEFEL